jgi:hypothetical protein
MLFTTDETPDLIKYSAGAYHPDADGICFFVGREIGLASPTISHAVAYPPK